MLSAAVDSYLAIRRTLGFRLRDTEMILRDFAAFASAKEDTHVCTHTVLEWIRTANASPLRSCVRLRTVVRFARYLHAEDSRHEVPPEYAFGRHRPHRTLRPRVHDLRFYFADQVLANSPADHQSISRHMVALTTYLGHSDARNSYWYLEATPALFSKIAERCEDFAKGGNP